jgi:hypothetical protein
MVSLLIQEPGASRHRYLPTRLNYPHLLPRCYQDRTNQPHLSPCREHPGLLLLLVGLGCLR